MKNEKFASYMLASEVASSQGLLYGQSTDGFWYVGNKEQLSEVRATPELRKFRCNFVGRNVGAIGITYPISTVVDVYTNDEIEVELYKHYEHISQLEYMEI